MKWAEWSQMIPRKICSSCLIIIFPFYEASQVLFIPAPHRDLAVMKNSPAHSEFWAPHSVRQLKQDRASSRRPCQQLPRGMPRARGMLAHLRCGQPGVPANFYHWCPAMLLHTKQLPGGKINTGQWIPVSKWNPEAAALWPTLVRAKKGAHKSQQYCSSQIKLVIQNI